MSIPRFRLNLGELAAPPHRERGPAPDGSRPPTTSPLRAASPWRTSSMLVSSQPEAVALLPLLQPPPLRGRP